MNHSTDFTVDFANKTVTIKREFSAGLEDVWEAWTNPEILDQWWAPKPFISKTLSMDFKVGGRRFYAMVNPEGIEVAWQIQEYTSINPKTDFQFFSAFTDRNENRQLPGSHWNVQFSENNGITTVHISI